MQDDDGGMTRLGPNVELRGAERDGEAGMRSVPLERRVGGESQSPQHGEKG